MLVLKLTFSLTLTEAFKLGLLRSMVGALTSTLGALTSILGA